MTRRGRLVLFACSLALVGAGFVAVSQSGSGPSEVAGPIGPALAAVREVEELAATSEDLRAGDRSGRERMVRAVPEAPDSSGIRWSFPLDRGESEASNPLTVRVVDPGGSGVRGAIVEFLGSVMISGYAKLHVTLQVTDKDGYASFPGNREGELRLRSNVQHDPVRSDSGDGVAELDKAIPRALVQPEDTYIQLQLQRFPCTIRGTVVGVSGEPIAASVQWMQGSYATRRDAGANGSFRIHVVLANELKLRFDHPGYASLEVTLVDFDGPTVFRTFELNPGREVELKLHGAASLGSQISPFVHLPSGQQVTVRSITKEAFALEGLPVEATDLLVYIGGLDIRVSCPAGATHLQAFVPALGSVVVRARSTLIPAGKTVVLAPVSDLESAPSAPTRSQKLLHRGSDVWAKFLLVNPGTYDLQVEGLDPPVVPLRISVSGGAETVARFH